MSISNIIQILMLGVLTVTLVVLAITMWAQMNLFAAQLLRDRYQMFFDSWAVEKEDVRQFREKTHLFVEKEDMEEDYFQKLLEKDPEENAIKNYLLVVQLYEYLAFAHALTFSTKYLGKGLIGKCWEKLRKRRNPNYTDSYGERWIIRWVEILIDDGADFDHVHKTYRKDHPEFYCFVEWVKDRVENRKLSTPEPDCKAFPIPRLDC